MKKKTGDFNFSLLFAIFAGSVILILAIYGVMKLGDTERFKTDTEIGKKIVIITDPLSAGFASGSYGKISFSSETKLKNVCLGGNFGKNDISVATRSGIGEEWNLAGGATSVYNKYIFGGGMGKVFYVFSKPFNFPFKVSDLVFLTSDDYCFVSPPDKIKEELLGLNMANIKLENCSENSTMVCFGSECDISVYGTCSTNCDSVFDEGYIDVEGVKLNYVDSLMYGAIFDPENYNCNVKRLMFRVGKIAKIFGEKAILMSGRGCDSNLVSDLNLLISVTRSAEEKDLIGINQIIKDIDKKADKEMCRLW